MNCLYMREGHYTFFFFGIENRSLFLPGINSVVNLQIFFVPQNTII